MTYINFDKVINQIGEEAKTETTMLFITVTDQYIGRYEVFALGGGGGIKCN